ncbi:MAG: N-6 DNA methylase [Myxococcales bacterium]|nr:N-6 DNA methylase [Myxococcales bacterium]
MVQPVEGLVVSVPVLVEAQCLERQPPEVQQRLVALATEDGRALRDLGAFLSELLGLTPDLFDAGEALPEALCLYVPEGKQLLRPTLALRKHGAARSGEAGEPRDATDRYVALVWDVAAAGPEGVGLDLDKPETVTGPWDYPAAAKFDRLLRHGRVPIGLVTNRELVRLVYAPHGESSGHITFRVEDMATVGGRPILDAFVMLLSASRFFGVAEERALPALLAESRKRQANVTNELAEQVLEALQILLRGFEAAAERDGRDLLDDALARDGAERDHLYKGLLTVLLRLVFLLYAEDRDLLPTDEPLYAEHLSVLGLFQALQEDAGAHPDSMSRRFGAWGRLVALFRAVFLGVEHGPLRMPARRGALFDPHRFPFLEGWGPAGSAPIVVAEDRAAVRVPTVDDETLFRVLEKLVVFEGQRLSYRTLDVEQIGSVYEALMGYHVVRLPAPAVCMRPDGIWVTAEELLAVPAARRAAWLKDTVGLAKAQADKLAEKLATAVHALADAPSVLEALAAHARTRRKADRTLAVARAGQLVLQPGTERRRTSSHYTPRSLSAPIVRRTLEPLLACMGPEPPSERLLELKICDPAMGSGAFLVEACRFLGDAVLAAWTREGKAHELSAAHEDPLLHARRMVAQRCLYGVDKNDSAVELAKLSLWLVTLAKALPFTFLDHALRHGDSLVGLSFEQIRAFHWKPGKQVHLAEQVLKDALDEAIAIRQQILALAANPDPAAQREKQRLLADSEDACDRARLVGDLVVGAFFARDKDKDRDKERLRRLDLVERWLAGGAEEEAELRALQADIRARLPVFHWMLEFPEVFYAERPDPLDDARVNRAAFMDAFVGNPPFAGKNRITEGNTAGYLDWLMALHPDVVGRPNTDLCAYFFRRAGALIGLHGTVGLVATNTIAQGDSRLMALRYLVDRGAHIYAATRTLPWPGAAAVHVAVVHLAVGRVPGVGPHILDGNIVDDIDSRLRPKPERPEPVPLAANANRAFMGGKLVGVGLAVSLEQHAALVAADPSNAAVLRPYLGGEEVNTNPDGSHSRYVIDFTTKTLEEARRWPMLMRIVEEKVKPTRMKDNRGTYKTYWWRPGESGGALAAALRTLERCLVAANVTKHLMFTFQPTTSFFSQTLYAFSLDKVTAFALLQSRIHEAWARLLSSSMKDDLRYAGSDCFATFPFPERDPAAVIPSLETIGERLYGARAKYMVETAQGLTQTYNKLKELRCHDAPILELRRLHEEMDRAVLDAYGWSDLAVPPFCPASPDEVAALEAFNDEVIDRLFVLNSRRSEDQDLARVASGATERTRPNTRRPRGRSGNRGQGTLGL